MDLHEELVAIIEALDGNELDYMLCGSLAVAFQGFSRFTRDIDVLVRAEDVDRVREVLDRIGYSEVAPWKDREILVISRDGLIRMKRLAGRDQDRLDLKKLGAEDE